MLRFIKNNFGNTLIIFLSLIPFFIWLSMKPIDLRISNLSLILTSLGEIFGLVGMAMFSLVLFLNTRVRFLEKFFYGLNRVYISHHNFGVIAFSILLFHPLYLISRSIIISVQFAFNFILAPDFTVLFGELALATMIILLVITLYFKFPYSIWKLTHKFLGLAYTLASIHVFFISSDVSAFGALRIYMLAMMAIGFFAIIYRTVLQKILVKKHKYIVDKVELISGETAEITLFPEAEKFDFVPGQFIFIKFFDRNVGLETHPFSISSSPNEEKLKVAIKNSGDFTAKIKILKVGIKAEIEGPFGKFSYLDFENQNQIWIAGGIGITPFLSMARNLNFNNADNSASFDLYYSVSNSKEMAFLNELMEISKKIKGLKILPFLSSESGYLTAEFIKKQSSGIDNKEIFICGPEMMMLSLKRQFLKAGVKKQNIHIEEFKLY